MKTQGKNSEEPVRWRAVEESRLIWRCWEEDAQPGTDPLTVVYFQDSDDTHLMNDLGAAIIHALQPKALSLDELLDVLARDYLPVPELRDVIPETLVEQFIHRMVVSGMIFEEKPDAEAF